MFFLRLSAAFTKQSIIIIIIIILKIKASRSPASLADLHKLEDNRLVGNSPPIYIARPHPLKEIFVSLS